MIRTALGIVAIIAIAVTVAVERDPYLADTLTWYAQVAFFACVALPVAGLCMFGAWMAHRAGRRDRTMVDGAWTMKRYRVRVWRSELPWPVALWEYTIGYPGELDRNRVVSSAYHIRPDGMIVEHVPAAGWAVQHAYNAEVERTNYIRAAIPGDDVWNTPYGQNAHPPRLPAPRQPRATVPMLPAPDGEIVDGDFTPVQMPFTEALHSGERTALVLGQSDDGNVATWDVEQAPHIRVHGKTQGSGKTNLIKQVALSAIRAGHHVIVLDRRMFKDWHAYRHHVELVDNRKPGAFMATAQTIKTLYQERDVMLGEAGAENIEALPDTPPRVFVVISEFGSAVRDLPEDEQAAVVAVLKTIISEAGATGVHLVMEDQTNSKWPREIRGNAEPITGYLPEDTAAAGGYKWANRLERYQFHYDGEQFRTWDMKVEAPRLLAGVRATGDVLVGAVPVPTENSFPGNERPIYENFSRNGNGNNERKWEDFARQWVADNQESKESPTALARAMCAADGNIKPYTDYKSEAARRLDSLRQEQPGTAQEQAEDLTPLEQLRQAFGGDLSSVRLANGERLGVDVTHTANGNGRH